ncbi:hypothetical protein DEM91_01680 [Prevotella sp. TCVGH]|nr:hypothetical protein [Prevotella sp. TCVGH]
MVCFAPTSKQPRVYPQGDKEVCGFTPIILSSEKHTEKDLLLLIKKYRFIDFDEPVFDAAKGSCNEVAIGFCEKIRSTKY